MPSAAGSMMNAFARSATTARSVSGCDSASANVVTTASSCAVRSTRAPPAAVTANAPGMSEYLTLVPMIEASATLSVSCDSTHRVARAAVRGESSSSSASCRIEPKMAAAHSSTSASVEPRKSKRRICASNVTGSEDCATGDVAGSGGGRRSVENTAFGDSGSKRAAFDSQSSTGQSCAMSGRARGVTGLGAPGRSATAPSQVHHIVSTPLVARRVEHEKRIGIQPGF